MENPFLSRPQRPLSLPKTPLGHMPPIGSGRSSIARSVTKVLRKLVDEREAEHQSSLTLASHHESSPSAL
jgi:hypothetical protein